MDVLPLVLVALALTLVINTAIRMVIAHRHRQRHEEYQSHVRAAYERLRHPMSALRLGKMPDGSRHVEILDDGSPVGEKDNLRGGLGGSLVVGDSEKETTRRYMNAYRAKKRAQRQQ